MSVGAHALRRRWRDAQPPPEPTTGVCLGRDRLPVRPPVDPTPPLRVPLPIVPPLRPTPPPGPVPIRRPFASRCRHSTRHLHRPSAWVRNTRRSRWSSRCSRYTRRRDRFHPSVSPGSRAAPAVPAAQDGAAPTAATDWRACTRTSAHGSTRPGAAPSRTTGPRTAAGGTATTVSVAEDASHHCLLSISKCPSRRRRRSQDHRPQSARFRSGLVARKLGCRTQSAPRGNAHPRHRRRLWKRDVEWVERDG